MKPAPSLGLLLLLGACGGGAGDPPPTATPIPVLSELVPPHLPRAASDLGSSLTTLDVDGDGADELVIGTGEGPCVVLRATAAGLADVTAEVGLAGVRVDAAAPVDVDGDGDLDLWVAAPGSVRLFANEGALVDRTPRSVAALAPVEPAHLLPFDADADGRMDLYVSDYQAPNLLLVADGEGGYREAAGELGLAGHPRTFASAVFDQDDDGFADLFVGYDALIEDEGLAPEYVATAPGTTDALYRARFTDGVPSYEDVAAAIRLDTARATMGGLVTDLDGDGRLDLFLSDIGRNDVLLTGLDGVLAHAAAALGLERALRTDAGCVDDPFVGPGPCLLVSWGAVDADLTGDGEGDLLWVNGHIRAEGERRHQPVQVFERIDVGFRELPSPGTTDGRALLRWDTDGDGLPELVVGQRDGVPLRLPLTPGEGLTVALRGSLGNVHGVGATVIAVDDAGGEHPAAVGAGGVVQVGEAPVARFALPRARVASLEVRWPGGLRQRVTPVRDARGALWVEEPPLLTLDREVAPVGETILVTIQPHGEDGAPLGPGHEVSLAADGASQPVEDLGDGRYIATLGSDVPVAGRLGVTVDGARWRVWRRYRFR